MNDQLSLKKIIERRKSIFPKDYTTEDIPQEVLEEVLLSATFAPNHKRTQPWRFKAFRGEEKLRLGEEIQQIYKATTPPEQFLPKKYDDILFKITKANVVISIVVELSNLVPEWEEIAATAMAVQNMYLTCTAYHLGCYWSSPKLVNHLKDALTIAPNQKCLGLFYMGNIVAPISI